MSRLIQTWLKRSLISARMDLPAVMADQTRVTFRNMNDADQFTDPMAFERAVFLTSQLPRCKKLANICTLEEKEEVELAISEFQKFGELRNFIEYCREVHKSATFLWTKLASNISQGTLVMTQEKDDDKDRAMITYVIDRYEELLGAVEEYPLWKAKIEMEIGYMVNHLHSIHVDNIDLEDIAKTFDKHAFFK